MISRADANSIMKETLRKQFDKHFNVMCEGLVKHEGEQLEQIRHELLGVVSFLFSLSVFSDTEYTEVRQCIQLHN